MLVKVHFRHQSGDTIVEVLIAILVLAAVLSGAYASANSSLINTRQAQERSEALKYIEGQVEQIKASTSLASSFGQTNGNFCFAKDGTGPVIASNSQCAYGAIPGGYRVSISPPVSNKYTLNAVWDRVGGGGTEQLTMVYRTYP